MRELREILEAIETGAAGDEPMALATIVDVQGSTYRREGARLLCKASGGMLGNISGGCLEGDVYVVAREVMETRRPRLVAYDLTADDDVVWGLGLGCNGRIDVFVEPVDPAAMRLDALRRVIDDEQAAAVAVVLEGPEAVPAGTRLLLLEGAADTFAAGGLPDAAGADRLRRAMAAALAEGRSRRRTVTTEAGALDIFVEVLRPPIRLVVCGAGHDAIPVVAQAAGLGWRVVVVDRRETYLHPDRFPGARFVRVDSFEETVGRVPVDGRTAILVMTHNYLHDRDVVRGYLTHGGSAPLYLGMLGPRARTGQILSDLRSEGIEPAPDWAARLHGPVGLDVGAEGPEEIALAAVAEIVAVERARGAGFLRDRRGPIHARAT